MSTYLIHRLPGLNVPFKCIIYMRIDENEKLTTIIFFLKTLSKCSSNMISFKKSKKFLLFAA